MAHCFAQNWSFVSAPLRKLVSMSVVRKGDKAAVNSDVLVAWLCLSEIQGGAISDAEKFVPEQIQLANK